MQRFSEFMKAVSDVALISLCFGSLSALIEPYKSKLECFRGIAAAVTLGVIANQLIDGLELSANVRSGIVSAVAYCARYITPLVGPFIKKLSLLLLRRLGKSKGGCDD